MPAESYDGWWWVGMLRPILGEGVVGMLRQILGGWVGMLRRVGMFSAGVAWGWLGMFSSGVVDFRRKVTKMTTFA